MEDAADISRVTIFSFVLEICFGLSFVVYFSLFGPFRRFLTLFGVFRHLLAFSGSFRRFPALFGVFRCLWFAGTFRVAFFGRFDDVKSFFAFWPIRHLDFLFLRSDWSLLEIHVFV